jgi:hypothetical protein
VDRTIDLVGRERREVDALDRDAPVGQDHLERLPIPDGEDRA